MEPTPMSKEDLVLERMIQWRSLALQMRAIEQEITPFVLEAGKNISVGKAEAVYSPGRREMDWKARANEIDLEIMGRHTTVTPVIDWKAVAMEFDPPKTLIDQFTTPDIQVDYKGAMTEAKLDPVVTKPGIPSVKFVLGD